LPAQSANQPLLYALLAGTRMRIGEAFGTKSVRPIARLPRRVLWRGKEQEPKTQNAIRDIETPEPLARLLRARVAGKSGYLFTTASGKPLSQRNALRTLHTTGKVGFHAFGHSAPRPYEKNVCQKT
jgi:integrase